MVQRDLGMPERAIAQFERSVIATPATEIRSQYLHRAYLLQAQVDNATWDDAEQSIRQLLPLSSEVASTRTELLAAILTAAPRQRAGPVGSGGGRVPIGPVADHMERTSRIIAAAEDAADMRRRMGAAALEMDAASDGSGPTRWRATVAARLPSQRWPERTMLITAVDARTGEPVVFDRHSGVDLVDAVAASTANGFGVPPYRIGDRQYIDGGYRRNENADLAAGYGRVLVLSPFGGRSRHPLEWRMHLAAQVDELRAPTAAPSRRSFRMAIHSARSVST